MSKVCQAERFAGSTFSRQIQDSSDFVLYSFHLMTSQVVVHETLGVIFFTQLETYIVNEITYIYTF